MMRRLALALLLALTAREASAATSTWYTRSTSHGANVYELNGTAGASTVTTVTAGPSVGVYFRTWTGGYPSPETADGSQAFSWKLHYACDGSCAPTLIFWSPGGASILCSTTFAGCASTCNVTQTATCTPGTANQTYTDANYFEISTDGGTGTFTTMTYYVDEPAGNANIVSYTIVPAAGPNSGMMGFWGSLTNREAALVLAAVFPFTDWKLP